MHNFSTNKHKLDENKDFTQDMITIENCVRTLSGVSLQTFDKNLDS